jgi:hypothetical protein
MKNVPGLQRMALRSGRHDGGFYSYSWATNGCPPPDDPPQNPEPMHSWATNGCMRDGADQG